jgi:hypothetical protein
MMDLTYVKFGRRGVYLTRITLGCDYSIVSSPHQNTATRTAEAARRLVLVDDII